MRYGYTLRLIAVVAAAATAACDSTGPAPPETLLGSWGGPGAELVASLDTVTLELTCLRGGFASSPALTGGEFTAPAELRAVNYEGTVQVAGSATGAWLQLTIVFPEPGASKQSYVLRQGAEGEFGDRLCLQ